MSADTRVRVCIDIAGTRQYFVRFIDDVRGPGLVPETVGTDNVGHAALLSRDYAIGICRRLRAADWNARVIKRDGTVLYETETAPPPAKEPWAERFPLMDEETKIMCRPATLNRWSIRFPNTDFGTIYAESAQAALDKLTSYLPQLIPHAERSTSR